MKRNLGYTEAGILEHVQRMYFCSIKAALYPLQSVLNSILNSHLGSSAKT